MMLLDLIQNYSVLIPLIILCRFFLQWFCHESYLGTKSIKKHQKAWHDVLSQKSKSRLNIFSPLQTEVAILQNPRQTHLSQRTFDKICISFWLWSIKQNMLKRLMLKRASKVQFFGCEIQFFTSHHLLNILHELFYHWITWVGASIIRDHFCRGCHKQILE